MRHLASVISRIERGRLNSVTIGTLRSSPRHSTRPSRSAFAGTAKVSIDCLTRRTQASSSNSSDDFTPTAGRPMSRCRSRSVASVARSTCSATTRRRGSSSSSRSSRSSLIRRPRSRVSIGRRDSLPTSRGLVGGRVAGSLACWSSATPRRRADGSTHSRRPIGPRFRLSGVAVRHWLRRPDGPMAGLLFLPYVPSDAR